MRILVWNTYGIIMSLSKPTVLKVKYMYRFIS